MASRRPGGCNVTRLRKDSVEKLKGLHVEIEVPDDKDPGQIACLFRKCVDLVRLLELAPRALQNLDVHFNDSANAKWFVDGEPQKSVCDTDRLNEPGRLFHNDQEIVAMAFDRLRNVRMAKVHLPENVMCDDGISTALDLEWIVMRQEAFGTRMNPADCLNDSFIQADLNDMFMALDVELDVLPGVTAVMMRLERFSLWYTQGLGSESKYERKLERILKTGSFCHNRNSLKHIQARYAAMRAFNPRSLYHRYLSNKESRWKDEFNDVTREAYDRGEMEEEWNREAWHNGYYPDGIPPFGSELFGEMMRSAGANGKVSRNYGREFLEKIKGWKIEDDEFSSKRSELNELVKKRKEDRDRNGCPQST